MKCLFPSKNILEVNKALVREEAYLLSTHCRSDMILVLES